MFSSERNELRQVFFTTWGKYLDKIPLEPLENQLLSVILLHPEYHALLENPDDYHDADFEEANPFLHMSLHLALREQLSTNRPAGICEIYNELLQKFTDEHLVEHKMMECLAEIIWEAQRNNAMPNEEQYLLKLRML